MKFKLLSILLVASSLFIISCGGDDDCDNLSETVVGSWSIDQLEDGTVTMNSDGGLVDNDNVIFDASLDNTTKTWDLSVDTLNLNADNGTVTEFTQFIISSFTCDQMIGVNNGNNFTFSRN